MSELLLSEYQRCGGVSLDADAVKALAGRREFRISPDPAQPGLWSLTADGWVGIMTIAGLELRIRPKVSVHRLLSLLSEVLALPEWDPSSEPELGHQQDLIALMAVMFCGHAERALRAGPLQGYVRVEEALPAIRGAIRVSAQLARRPGRWLPIEVTFDDYTVDVAENQMVAGAATHLGRLHGLPIDVERRLRRHGAMLEGVTPVRPSPSTPDVAITRLNERYRHALVLARLVLRSGSLDDSNGPRSRGEGFMVNMAQVFEQVVGTDLRSSAAAMGRDLVLEEEYPFDTGGLLTIRPDVLVREQGTVTAVADLKYKAPRNGRALNEDVYQVLAYARSFGLTTAHLIYADLGPAVCLEVGGCRVLVHTVSLDQPAALRRAQTRDVAAALVADGAARFLGE